MPYDFVYEQNRYRYLEATERAIAMKAMNFEVYLAVLERNKKAE